MTDEGARPAGPTFLPGELVLIVFYAEMWMIHGESSLTDDGVIVYDRWKRPSGQSGSSCTRAGTVIDTFKTRLYGYHTSTRYEVNVLVLTEEEGPWFVAERNIRHID
jgi:dihydroorotase-like cyclic amidohydrolase